VLIKGATFDGCAEERAERAANAVIGAAIEVHRSLGPGYSESVYQLAMEVELAHRRIPFERQKSFILTHRGMIVGEGKLDLLVDQCLVVELKSVETVLPVHRAQALSYLKALDLELALVLNFNMAVMKSGISRILNISTSS
jgi:GxxExxY protein